jgi:hypothetical protein
MEVSGGGRPLSSFPRRSPAANASYGACDAACAPRGAEVCALRTMWISARWIRWFSPVSFRLRVDPIE